MGTFYKIPALLLLLCISSSITSGCASVVTKESLERADLSLTPYDVQINASEHIGKNVLWGGLIISVENLKDFTIIEVFQSRLDSSDRPTLSLPKENPARFLIKSPEFLDTLIYTKEMGITVVGTVLGLSTRKIGERDYPYPVITPVEIHLYDVRSAYEDTEPLFWPYPPYPLYPYPYPYYGRPYGPYWPYYPY